jgi:hypothetical protein
MFVIENGVIEPTAVIQSLNGVQFTAFVPACT